MKHIISIGINKTDGLSQLGAAASGAKDFAKWGKSQGYITKLFIDDKKSISQAEIFNEINNIISDKNSEMLIVFFSGHGLLRSPGQEIWLLSNAKTNPNESINLTGSIDNARLSGIPYVVFISDACRVLPNELQFTGNGSVIFPIHDYTEDCAIDLLYATRPGNPALEKSSKENVNNFGLFTQTIIEVLSGDYPELIKAKKSGDSLITYYDLQSLKSNKNYKNSSNDVWKVDFTNVKDLIRSVVQQKAKNIKISLTQDPDIRIEVQNPKPYLSLFDDKVAKKLLLTQKILLDEEFSKSVDFTIKGVQKEWEYYDSTRNAGLVDEIPHFPPAKTLNQTVEKLNLVKNSRTMLKARGKGRGKFETQTGFTIIGTAIKDMIVNGNRDIFSEDNLMHIRIHPQVELLSGLLILDDDRSIPVAILEGYIGTLVFDNNQLLTINYTPSLYSPRFQSYEQNEDNIEYARAFVASAANEGFDYSKTFDNEFDKNGHMNYSNAGSYLRHDKSIDPSLGLYACYAYRQEGKLKDVKSVYDYSKIDNEKIIFDVAMLAGMINDKEIILAPFCPMIALGWAYNQHFEKELHPSIMEASKHLVPALWTTFNKTGTAIIKELFNQKLIS